MAVGRTGVGRALVVLTAFACLPSNGTCTTSTPTVAFVVGRAATASRGLMGPTLATCAGALASSTSRSSTAGRTGAAAIVDGPPSAPCPSTPSRLNRRRFGPGITTRPWSVASAIMGGRLGPISLMLGRRSYRTIRRRAVRTGCGASLDTCIVAATSAARFGAGTPSASIANGVAATRTAPRATSATSASRAAGPAACSRRLAS